MIGLLFGVLVNFAWNARPAEEAVTTYKLLLGASPGNYTQTVDVGNVTSKQLDVAASMKFAAVVAVNAFGDSDPSTAVTVSRPQSPAGLAAAPGS